MKKSIQPQNVYNENSAGVADPSKPFSFEELEKILLYFSTAILEKNTEEEILWDLAKNCISQLGFVDCVIYLVDENKQALVQKAAYGPKNPKEESILQPIDIPIGKGITGSVALSGVAEIVKDTSLDSRYILDDAPRFSEIAVPILTDGKVLGVIDCEHPERHFFTQQHLRILSAIASICAIKLSRVKAERLAMQEQQRVMEAQQQMEELKAQALKAQMNPHFLFNALSAIQYFITENDKKSALSYLSLFSKLIRYRLEYFREETTLLSDEIEVMNWYLKLQKLRYGDNFHYQVEISEADSGRIIRIPSLIFPFVLESAVELSMLEQPAGHLHLTIELAPREVRLVLLHNLSTLPVHRPAGRSGYREDMEPWQKQLEKLNALQHYHIQEKTTFLKDDNGKISGVEIQLKIPILE